MCWDRSVDDFFGEDDHKGNCVRTSVLLAKQRAVEVSKCVVIEREHLDDANQSRSRMAAVCAFKSNRRGCFNAVEDGACGNGEGLRC